MKILVIGEFYSSNLGDAVICESTSYILSKKIKNNNVDILDFSGREEFSTQKIELNKVDKFSLKKLIKKNIYLNSIIMYIKGQYPKFNNINLEDYDGVILAGGQLFLWYFFCPLIVSFRALHRKNIKTTLNSVGYGKLDNYFSRKFISKYLNKDNIKYISVRDHKKEFEKLTRKEIFVSPDSAIFSADCYGVDKDTNSHQIGLGIMYIEGKREILKEYWKNVIEILNRENKEWSFFVNGAEKDYEFAIEILEELGFPVTDKYLKDRPVYPIDLVNLISSFERIMSFRLHSHIISYSLRIPTIALSWDNKVNSFFNMIDKSDNVFNYTDKDIEKMVKKLFESSYDNASDDDLYFNLREQCLQNLYSQIEFFK
ncbi:hypothetical protein BG261_06775 [Floricoccus tropicus]|uniref:Polysaccharide pyruvyl transferase domain-containing protein n=1 Tax=Floricoccus tropicus TaxID=1859473 RepID=A0A1E8GK16_9LACT|nr:polysaccharide pyruvyl transferase family protein [Floricoccus tropicus]OFI48594.1 hypothetical protein BG261_06775 [Floricoccus tropicus]